MSIDDQFAALFKEFNFRVRVDGVDPETLAPQMIARAYALGYQRHAEMFGRDNQRMCRMTDNMNICEGGPLGPTHQHKFPFIY